MKGTPCQFIVHRGDLNKPTSEPCGLPGVVDGCCRVHAVIPPAPARYWADIEDPDYEGPYFDHDETIR